jgi:uncharacterized protein
MKFSLEQTGGNRISGYQTGEIRIQCAAQPSQNGAPSPQRLTVTQSVIITPTRIIEDWAPQQITELNESHLQPLLDIRPEVLLLGTGPTLQFAAPALMRQFYEAGIGVETMDTGAACRTFNILIAEGRQVTAALFMP